MRSMFEYITREIGQLDIVVSNAATGGFRPLLAANQKHFQNTFQTNVLALLYLVQSALPLLERGPGRGKVIALSSHGSDTALPWYGLIGSSEGRPREPECHFDAFEVGDRGVNVNVVKAGLLETDSTRRIPNAEQIFVDRKDKSMMGDRMLAVEDVANAVLFLASPLADLIQGETLTVDGGSGRVHV